MSIFEAIAVFLIGILVGYMICMGQWVKELCRQSHENEMEISRIMAEMRGEDEND